jgi:hypothetical protein
VTFTTSGTSGDYTLDFSVGNTLGGTDDVYFFGVYDPNGVVSGSPSPYDPNLWPSWNNSPYGGNNVTYNNNWIDLGLDSLEPGATLSGFDVLDDSATAPASVAWFAIAAGGYYGGSDYFNNPYNPGFQGVTGSSTPGPAAVLPMVGGLIALRRRRRA